MELVGNKRGWIRMLEATVAIMLVSGVLISVYSGQVSRPDSSELVFGMQKKILMDISSRSDLRLDVMKVLSAEAFALATPTRKAESEGALLKLNLFVNQSVPSSYGYALKVCDLGSACELSSPTSIDNFRNDVDVFVEETIISAVVSNGTGGQTYNPKKVKLFIWEDR